MYNLSIVLKTDSANNWYRLQLLVNSTQFKGIIISIHTGLVNAPQIINFNQHKVTEDIMFVNGLMVCDMGITCKLLFSRQYAARLRLGVFLRKLVAI